MKFFDLNIALDDSKKTVSTSIKKDKNLSLSYKKNKSKILKYPEDKDSWDTFYSKFNNLVDKL